MKPAIVMFFYFLLAGGPGAGADEVVDIYLRDARKQLIAYSDRAATAMQDTRCYRCGDCCKYLPCRHGKWNEARDQCLHLKVDVITNEFTTYKCAIYYDIVQKERGTPLAIFGGGCRNTLHNTARERIRSRLAT